MTKISKIDRATAKLIDDRMAAALTVITAELGLSMKRCSSRFSDTSVTCKFEFSVIAADGVVQDKTVTDYKRFADFSGLEGVPLGAQFYYHGDRFTVVGFRAKARNKPVIIKKESDGRQYAADAMTVRTNVEKFRTVTERSQLPVTTSTTPATVTPTV